MTLKKLLTFVVLLTSITKAYSETDEERIKAMFWKSNDPDFAVKKCDDKWKKESAVILCKKYDYRVQKQVFLTYVNENIYTHTRILLNDKAAVNEYSTFNFNISKSLGSYSNMWNKHNIFVGVKIVKANGKEQEVPIDKKLIDEIRSGMVKETIQKIAIPGLEVGDILDYYFASEDKEVSPGAKFNIFSPVIYNMVDKYPIMKHKIEMHVMRKCYLNAKSMNGAPEFTLVNDSKRTDMMYTITDTNRDKAKEELWSHPLRDLPVIIFQAYFVNYPMVKNRLCFYDESDIIKKKVSDQELLDFYDNMLKDYMSEHAGKVIKYIKKNFKNVTDPNVIAHEAYNYYRQLIYTPNYQYDLVGSGDGINPPGDVDFVATMSKVLSELKIKHDLVITVPRRIGSVNDLIMLPQMDFLIRVNGKAPLFLSNFTKYSLYNELDPSMQGNEALAIEAHAKKATVTKVTIPVMGSGDNKEVTTLNVTFNPDEAEKLVVASNITTTGVEKWNTNYILATSENYIKECKEEKYGLKMAPLSFKKQTQRLEQILDKERKEREEYLSAALKNEMDVKEIKMNKYELVQPGMWDNAPELKYKIDYELNKYISKAGNNIILDAGKLIGSQVTLESSDSLRKFNIYMPYARTYENQIYVEIPQGYTVKGTNNLTFNVTNETGGFVSSAKVEGNKLVIRTSKYFTNNYFSKESWSSIRKFLTAANDFQNQKVMFVPGK